MVQETQPPALTVALDHREGCVVLAQGENALEGHPEGPAQHDTVWSAVGDHEHRAPGVAGLDGFQGGPPARCPVAPAPAPPGLEAPHIGPPGAQGPPAEGTE